MAPSNVAGVWVSGAQKAASALEQCLTKHAADLEGATLQLHSRSGALYVRWWRSPAARLELARTLAVAAKANVYLLEGGGGSMDFISSATAFGPGGKLRWTQTEDVGKERAALLAAARARREDFPQASADTLSTYAGLLRFYGEKDVPGGVRLEIGGSEVLEPSSEGFTAPAEWAPRLKKSRGDEVVPLRLRADMVRPLATELFDLAVKGAPVPSAVSLRTKLEFEQAVALTQLLQRTPRVDASGPQWEKRFGRTWEPSPTPPPPPPLEETEFAGIQLVDLAQLARPKDQADSLWEWIQTGGATRSRHLRLELVGVRNLAALAKDRWFESAEFRYCRFGRDERLPAKPRPSPGWSLTE